MMTFAFAPRARRRALAVAACVLGLLSLSHSLRAHEGQPTFRASITVVPITAVVRDAKNRVVRTLQKDDFEVIEDDRPRRVVDFGATDRGPVSLAVLFDTSGSMRGTNLETGRIIVNKLLDQLSHASDEAALFTFDQALTQHTPFTSDQDLVRQALNVTEGWGVTSLYDAIAETAKQAGERRAQRRAIVVVTDGIDTSSRLTPSDVSGLASAINVPVYIIPVVSPGRPRAGSAMPSSDDALASLSYWTGGDVRRLASPEHAAEVVTALMDELRQQYFLAIESAAASGWYRLEVRTKRKDLTVRARSGYFATDHSWPKAGR